jgi:hypothetical protein
MAQIPQGKVNADVAVKGAVVEMVEQSLPPGNLTCPVAATEGVDVVVGTIDGLGFAAGTIDGLGFAVETIDGLVYAVETLGGLEAAVGTIVGLVAVERTEKIVLAALGAFEGSAVA